MTHTERAPRKSRDCAQNSPHNAISLQWKRKRTELFFSSMRASPSISRFVTTTHCGRPTGNLQHAHPLHDHQHSHTEHGHSHAKMDGPGLFNEREPVKHNRNWCVIVPFRLLALMVILCLFIREERSFTVGVSGTRMNFMNGLMRRLDAIDLEIVLEN